MNRKRVAVLISGRGSNMAALIEAAEHPAYPAEIVLVISNRPDAPGLAKASAADIPTLVLESAAYKKGREAFDEVLDQALKEHKIDLVCLAGFMRLLSPWFVERWHGRILNIHPALLPAFQGLHTHERALAAGIKIHGATVHFVVAEMDAGPIIAQVAVAVAENDTADTLAERVLACEHQIYPMALQLVAEGRVKLIENRCTIDGAGHVSTCLVSPSAGNPSSEQI
jgi:phosphoribosylglycinamide formyltransferase-1